MLTTADFLFDLDKKHRDLLDRLTQLDEEITGVLQEWTKMKEDDATPERVENSCRI